MAPLERPAKRAKLLSESEPSSDEADTTAKPNGGLKINEEYARRFEHNKKREEKDRLEEKYGRPPLKRVHDEDGVSEEDEESSEDESEDDDAELATKDLDDEIEETLAAIKRKDPRVYDKEVKFYREFEPETEKATGMTREKPMSLHDYHRRNLLEGYTGDGQEDGQNEVPRTYAQEQEELRRDLVGDLHTNATNGELPNDDEDEFLVAKSKPTRNEILSKLPSKEITDADVAAADKDPESYLSNFMAARAWLPTATSRWAAFESDESEDEKRADEFEEAYNLRFEDPEHANEKLMTFSRDANKYSVRRDDVKGGARKRAREREKEKKDQEKRERQEERKRLRDLRVEETAEKVKKIREAAGLRGKEVNIDDWRDVLEGEFDDSRWEKEMRNRFGESYYAAEDDESFSEPEVKGEGRADKKRKLKKPMWDDDIHINDLVPEFEKEDVSKPPAFMLSSDDELDNDEDGGVSVAPLGADERDNPDDAKEVDPIHPAQRRSKKDLAKEKQDARRVARIERRKIEEMVDSNFPLEHPSLSASTSNQPVAGFRYRETSPTSFGMTARDILFANDSQLNQFAGLKKMAAFRDLEKKRKDKKRYSKKGRLREWRREVFGTKDEPSGGFEKVLGRREDMQQDDMNVKVEGDAEGAKTKKRKRSKKQKQKQPAPAA
jgi:protein KRI1